MQLQQRSLDKKAMLDYQVLTVYLVNLEQLDSVDSKEIQEFLVLV